MKRDDDHVTLMQKLTAPRSLVDFVWLVVIMIAIGGGIAAVYGAQFALCTIEHPGWSLMRCVRR